MQRGVLAGVSVPLPRKGRRFNDDPLDRDRKQVVSAVCRKRRGGVEAFEVHQRLIRRLPLVHRGVVGSRRPCWTSASRRSVCRRHGTLRDAKGHQRTNVPQIVIGRCYVRAVVRSSCVVEVSVAADEPNDVLTAEEAAAYLRVSQKTIYRLVAAGKVPGTRVGRSWRFRRADLVAFLQARS